ncbi:MAG TPA: cobalamin-dependent protein [Spirochaetia bacterium]|nr:cobalamin-dependent protein [Spirochaetia bacterium]
MLMAIWNSVAARRRSISDTFLDNGLAALKGHLEDEGHEVRVIDWATDDFYSSLSPRILGRPLRNIYSRMMRLKSPALKAVLGIVSMSLQDVLTWVERSRMDTKLRELAAFLAAEGINVVGVKVWYGEAFVNAARFAEYLRRFAPEVLIIAGGYHVTLYEGKILEQASFDLGVEREGERALTAILGKAMAHKESWQKQAVLKDIIDSAERGEIANLIYRKNGGVCASPRLDSDAERSSVPRYEGGAGKVLIHVVTDSLGCGWGRCNFCVHRQFSSRFAMRSVDGIVAEIEALLEAGVGVFRFAGSDTPPAFGARIARRLLEKDIHITFAMGSRAIKNAGAHHEELVRTYEDLIKAGLCALFMGGETGNDFVNQVVMNKGLGRDDIVSTVKALREAERNTGGKVFLSLALIYPTPLLGQVSLEEVREDNIRLLQETRPDSVMITPPGPFPHTVWYKEAERFGFEVDDKAVLDAMRYEYVLYKPPQFWPKLGIKLEGKPFEKLLIECSDLRSFVQRELGIPTDISDEHFLMFYAAGIRDARAILEEKDQTMLDILSCDYRRTHELSQKVNDYSRKLSAANTTARGATRPSYH